MISVRQRGPSILTGMPQISTAPSLSATQIPLSAALLNASSPVLRAHLLLRFMLPGLCSLPDLLLFFLLPALSAVALSPLINHMPRAEVALDTCGTHATSWPTLEKGIRSQC